MPQKHFAGPALLTATLFIATLSAGACNRAGDPEAVPANQMVAETSQEDLNSPVSVTGCLRAGDAAGTFVLTTTGADGDSRPATYALHYPAGMQPEDLRDHVGKQVHVEGTVQAQHAAHGYTPPAPAANDPVATSGSEPTVNTTTEVAVRELAVASLRPLEDACPTDR